MSKISQREFPSELHLILNTIQAGVIVHTKDTSISFCNAAAQDILGLSNDEILGKTAADPEWHFFDESDCKLGSEEYPVKRVLRDKKGIQDMICGVNRPKTEDKIWLQLNAIPVLKEGEVDQVVISFVDITTQIQSNRQLQRSREIFRKIFNKTPMGMCITDEQGYFESVNPAYLELYGYDSEEVIGNHFTMVVPEEHRLELSNLHDTFIREGTEIRGRWDVVDKNGTTKSVLADAARIIGHDNRPRKVTFVIDITREREYENHLKRMALTDPLTRLFNRRHFFKEMKRERERSQRYESAFSVAMFDIDHFKKVNDTYGHDTGDEVLKQIARIMNETLRDPDTICRYGGEEFIVLMPDTKLSEARSAAERVRQSVESSDFPKGMKITISGGISQYRQGTISDFINEVDKLMYTAKEKGRNRIIGQ